MFDFQIVPMGIPALHPHTKQPIIDNDGNVLDMFPNQQKLKWDGVDTAYVLKNQDGSYRLRFLFHTMPHAVKQAATEFVEKEMNAKAAKVTQPPVPAALHEDDIEDE